MRLTAGGCTRWLPLRCLHRGGQKWRHWVREWKQGCTVKRIAQRRRRSEGAFGPTPAGAGAIGPGHVFARAAAPRPRLVVYSLRRARFDSVTGPRLNSAVPAGPTAVADRRPVGGDLGTASGAGNPGHGDRRGPTQERWSRIGAVQPSSTHPTAAICLRSPRTRRKYPSLLSFLGVSV